MDPRHPLLVDTNVFLRFFTGDNEAMRRESRELFESAASGNLRLWTTRLVLAEVAWTLRSFYDRSHQEIADVLQAVIDLPGLRVEGGETTRFAIDLFAERTLGFADAVHAAEVRARGYPVICSYDRDFDMPGVSRLTPGDVIAALTDEN